MTSRVESKQISSLSPSGNAYEMQPYRGEAVTSTANGKSGGIAIIEEDDSEHRGATANDQRDMKRLGKTQELSVRRKILVPQSRARLNMDDDLEKLSLPFHIWILATLGQRVGNHNCWTTRPALEWWYSGHDLDVPGSHRWLGILYSVDGGDGKHSTYGVSQFLETAYAEPVAKADLCSGGQYHWVSEFAPEQYQRFLSYMTGWLSVTFTLDKSRAYIDCFQVLGWQTALVSTSYSAALAVQGMIAMNMADYTVPAWHGALLTIGAVLLTIIFNTVLLRKLPTFEGGMLVLHVFAFIAVFVVLWVMGDKAPAKQVFTEFSDPQGWGSVSSVAKSWAKFNC